MLMLLHGSPGVDHLIYQPRFAQLADMTQVIFLDHRGNGRSEPGPRELWMLAQWGDDVHTFCEALGIEHPIVLGTSFGGDGRIGVRHTASCIPHQVDPAEQRSRGRHASGGESHEVRGFAEQQHGADAPQTARLMPER
jgi:hypothetical protein